MWARSKIVWSSCELDYLKEKREERTINELSLYLAKSRSAVKRKLDEFDGKIVPKINKKGTKIGKRPDILNAKGLPCFFRSGWEANTARWLTHTGKTWEYEPEVFPFWGVPPHPDIRHGTMSYCPDFRYGKTGLWLEVKGFLTSQGRTAINRMRKYYPAEFKKLRAIVGSPGTKADQYFKKIGVPVIGYMTQMNKKHKNTIDNWE